MAELSYFVQKSQRRVQNQEAILQYLSLLVISEFDADAGLSYGQIRAEL